MENKVCCLCGKRGNSAIFVQCDDKVNGITVTNDSRSTVTVRNLKKYGYTAKEGDIIDICSACARFKINRKEGDNKLEDEVILRVVFVCYAAIEIREKSHTNGKRYNSSLVDTIEWLKEEYLADIKADAPTILDVLIRYYLLPNEAYFFMKSYAEKCNSTLEEKVNREVEYIVNYFEEYYNKSNTTTKLNEF